MSNTTAEHIPPEPKVDKTSFTKVSKIAQQLKVVTINIFDSQLHYKPAQS
jgi:hypothetical protein